MPDNADTNAAAPTSSKPAKAGFWQSLKRGLISTEAEFSFFKGLTFIGFLGTLIVAYFQYLSAYQDKVATLARQDLTEATLAFTEGSSALSIPLSLQERLIFEFYDATHQKVDTDDKAYVTKSARALNKSYDDAYTALRENINLIARKMEIYLDWPSNIGRDPAADNAIGADPINISLLGAYGFDCDKNMPSFDKENSTLHLKRKDGKLDVDWYSAKHHVLTIQYCFDLTHKFMEPVRQWASMSPVDPAKKGEFLDKKSSIQDRLDKQVLRLNAFMSVAMSEIERIRVKYRPNGFVCNVPGVRETIGIFSRRCTPIRTSELD